MSNGFIPVLSFEPTVTRQHYQLKLIETWAGTPKATINLIVSMQYHP